MTRYFFFLKVIKVYYYYPYVGKTVHRIMHAGKLGIGCDFVGVFEGRKWFGYIYFGSILQYKNGVLFHW